jgi:hypothetical protein
MARTGSPKQREAARRWCLENRPWERSSGPKSHAGQARAAKNRFVHGRWSNDAYALQDLIVTAGKLAVEASKGSKLPAGDCKDRS